MRPMVAMYHTWQVSTIVSSFFRLPLRSAGRRVLQVGPLLRPELRRVEPTPGDHLLSYLRANTPERVLDVLRASRRSSPISPVAPRWWAPPGTRRSARRSTWASRFSPCPRSATTSSSSTPTCWSEWAPDERSRSSHSRRTI
jgi:hypothetical protein